MCHVGTQQQSVFIWHLGTDQPMSPQYPPLNDSIALRRVKEHGLAPVDRPFFWKVSPLFGDRKLKVERSAEKYHRFIRKGYEIFRSNLSATVKLRGYKTRSEERRVGKEG